MKLIMSSRVLTMLLPAISMVDAFAPLLTTTTTTTSTTALFGAPVDRRSAAQQSLAAILLFAQAPAAHAESATLDFSLPSSYDTKMGGFGEMEAILNTKGSSDRTDPGANEKEKQLETMRRAEEARKARVAAQTAARKAQEEEDKRRADEKKKRDAEKLKNIWGDREV